MPTQRRRVATALLCAACAAAVQVAGASAREPIAGGRPSVQASAVRSLPLHLRLPVLPLPAVTRPAAPRDRRQAVAVGNTPRPDAARRLALLWPSGGIVTSRFGWRTHPIFGRPEFHTGVDIATRYGSPVVAARAGVVCFAGWKSGYGRIVVLRHDGGMETSYSHLSASLVSAGEQVARGQMIGRIGSSGWSTGPHLFFEVRRNGVPLDPARYLN